MTPRVDILPLIVIFLLFAILSKSIFFAFRYYDVLYHIYANVVHKFYINNKNDKKILRFSHNFAFAGQIVL